MEGWIASASAFSMRIALQTLSRSQFLMNCFQVVESAKRWIWISVYLWHSKLHAYSLAFHLPSLDIRNGGLGSILHANFSLSNFAVSTGFLEHRNCGDSDRWQALCASEKLHGQSQHATGKELDCIPWQQIWLLFSHEFHAKVCASIIAHVCKTASLSIPLFDIVALKCET